MDDNIKIKGEWFFEYEDGSIEGPFFNSFPPAGLAKIAEKIENFSAPYLVVGDDTAEGYVISEVYRQQVSAVTRSANLVRFRTQILPSNCNGDHEKVCIFVEGSGTSGTGTMLNMLRRLWTKTDTMSLTVECRITVSEVS